MHKVFYLSHFHIYDVSQLVANQAAIQQFFGDDNFITYDNDDASFILAGSLQEALDLDVAHCAHLQIENMRELKNEPCEPETPKGDQALYIVDDIRQVLSGKPFWSRHKFLGQIAESR